MSDPLRLSATHRRSLTAAMLDSARDDDPPASARQRALVAFGAGTGAILTAGIAEGGASVVAGAAGTSAAAGGSMAKLATWLVVAKWAGGGAAVAVFTAAAIASVPPRGSKAPIELPAVVSPVSAPSPVAEIARPVTAPVIAASPNATTVDVPSPQVPAMTSHGQQGAPSRAARQSAPTPGEPTTEPVAHPPDESLLGEVGWLDRASNSIRSGDVEKGLQMLDEYKVRFPSAVLAPESQVLRIEALVRKGDRAGATRMGEAFLARTPQSALAARVRSLLASTQKEQTP